MLEDVFRKAVKRGQFTHLSIVSDGRGGFRVAFVPASGPYIHTSDSDVVKAIADALNAGMSKPKKSEDEAEFG